MLTQDQIAQALPANLKSAATPSFTAMVNGIVSDPLIAEQVRENFISYSRVLSEGKFKTEDYLHAVTYVSFKLMGMTNLEAYCRTFPARHAALAAKGTSSKDISAYVAAYHRGKLVNLIMEQSLVPSWVLNQDIHQKAINHLATLMTSASSEKVQAEAAIGLLTHLAKPKEAGPLVSIDMRETSGTTELRGLLKELAQQQQAAIAAGISPAVIAAQRIIDVAPEPVP
ncbi:hypothetical protein [Roseococcus sp.]|uniref:hypothetical protein n=1 Tax=Roseococcus sp. TaxID=2109646 RepID=UPI003BADA313